MYIALNFFQSNFNIIVSVILFYFIAIKFWYRFGHKFFLYTRNEVQTIHRGKIEVPRFGGILLVLGSLCMSYLSPLFLYQSSINQLIFFSIPMIFAAIYEDLFYLNSPIFRLGSTFISIILFFIFVDVSLPYIDIPHISEFINNRPLFYLILIVGLAGLINGMNLIDGANGLLSITALTSLISLASLAYLSDDTYVLSISLVLIAPLFIFLFFNYPSGKIFLGDAGAYWLGWSIGLLVLIFYGRNPQIPAWGAFLLLFYPTLEIIFSFFRKIRSGRSPFRPDPYHLHLLIYFQLEKVVKNKLLANNLVMPILLFFCAAPPVALVFSYNNFWLILILLISFTTLYLLFYRVLRRRSE